jgi:ATP-dependent DNA ligase
VVLLRAKLGQDFPFIAAAIARLPVNDATLDGEAACLSTEDGNFHALRSRHARQDARPIV